MATIMKRIACFSVLITIFCAVLHMIAENDSALTLLITFGTISYHFVMRLSVGFMMDLLLKNRVNYYAKWFRVSSAEQRFYKKLQVKKWKGKMGTYDPRCFDSSIHSWDEIAQATCQAELVHEVIIIFSFLPICASIPFGVFPVFLITSILAACFDAMFVIMQRYNRPRIMRLMSGAKKH